MEKAACQRLQVYQLAEKIADLVWTVVMKWSAFDRASVGGQLVRAADSIGANIAEGYGRGTPKDNQRFVRIARGSLNETIHFLRRAYRRKLINEQQSAVVKSMLDELGPKLNNYLRSIGTTTKRRKTLPGPAV